jgi:hypothetical protein
MYVYRRKEWNEIHATTIHAVHAVHRPSPMAPSSMVDGPMVRSITASIFKSSNFKARTMLPVNSVSYDTSSCKLRPVCSTDQRSSFKSGTIASQNKTTNPTNQRQDAISGITGNQSGCARGRSDTGWQNCGLVLFV